MAFTSINARPLWTPKVYPTISGVITESRDQVLITVFDPGVVRAICLIIAGCTNGPFLRLRVMKSFYFRRDIINTFDFFLLPRVFTPRAGLPHGVAGPRLR